MDGICDRILEYNIHKERKDSTSSTASSSNKRDRSRAGEDTPSKKRDDKRSPGPKPKK